MSTADASRSEARRRAEDRFAKMIRRDAEVRAYQQQQSDAEAAKIARLRALRVARDADATVQRSPIPKKSSRTGGTKASKSATRHGAAPVPNGRVSR